jgi:outer membrane protein OmpA-like peptidoglycan-associated protein
MRTTTIWTVAGALAVAGLTLPGCAPRRNENLAQARASYQAAQQDPQVSAHAPVALHEAQQALTEAERALERDRDQETVDTLAYVADRKVAIARQVAEREQAEERAKQLAEQREQVLLGARTGEARAAEARVRQLETRETARGTVLRLGDVLFEVDSAQLKPGAMNTLDTVADTLARQPDRQIEIEGHTDSTGAASYNASLSRARAESVRDFLVRRGIAADRVTVQGMGEAYPIATNKTAAGRQLNRRVEVIIERGDATAGVGRRPPEPTSGR